MKKTVISRAIAAAYGLLGRPPHTVPMAALTGGEGWDG